MLKLKPSTFAYLIALLFVTACGTDEKKSSPAQEIDMKLFFKNGDKSSFRISPDGNYYAYRGDYLGKMNIFIQKTGDTSATRITSDTLRSISQYLWKSDRIVFLQDVGGDENFQFFSPLL